MPGDRLPERPEAGGGTVEESRPREVTIATRRQPVPERPGKLVDRRHSRGKRPRIEARRDGQESAELVIARRDAWSAVRTGNGGRPLAPGLQQMVGDRAGHVAARADRPDDVSLGLELIERDQHRGAGNAEILG